MTGFGEIVAPTAAISAILGTYPFSIGLLREILQNSDDAKARIQIFVLDHRTYPGSRLIDPRLVEAQGPSLLAYNNATFNEQDWIALQRINESSKREDTSKIGKYGVGFRSCYHITDSPQILSGSSLAILDPHHAYGPGGYKVTFTENPDAYADHLAAFCPSQFDPNWTPERPFEGTIIRLPLRQDASWSKISTKTLNTMEIKKLLLDFVKEEIDISLLFLSHISSTEIIEVDGHDRRVLGKVKIERAASPPASSSHVSAERLERCTVFVDDDSDGVLIRRSQDWCILHVTFPIEMCTKVLSPKLGPHTASRLQREKLKPILGLAVPLPLNHTRPGRLFTYLPLPLPTGFPLHVHALFALTQARQNLWSCSEKGMVRGTRDELLVEWNKVLFNTFIPKIWAHLLSRLLDDLKTPTDIFYAWPPESQRTPGGDPAYWQSLALHTLQSVIEENLSIWPLVHPHSAGSFGPMNSTFVATTSDIPFLSALSNAGIYATVPPAYIVEMLHTLDMKCQWLCPSEVQTALRNNLPSVANLRDEDKTMLLSYLTCDGSRQRVIGIPVIPLANGSYVALQNASHPSHVYLDDNETRLFADHDESAITLSRLPSSVQKLFQSSAANTVNITPLHASLVSQYLPKVFEVHGLLFSVSGATPTEMSIYLHEFWSWLSNWQDREALFPSIKHFAILPNSSGVHQVLDDIIFKQDDIDTSTQALFLHLGIPFLAPNFPSSSIVFLERRGVVKSVYNLASLLDKLQTKQVGELDESGRRVLLSHFSNSLARHRGSPSQECEQRIKCLPIYPNFMYRDSATIVPIINYGPIPNESNLFINVPQVRMLSLDGSVLLPHIDGSKFVASQYGNMDYQSILSYLNILSPSYLSESDLINRFIEHLHKQPKQVKRMFIQCLSRHQHDIAPNVVRSLRTASFIPCGSGSTLVAPQDAIDPDSNVATLFPRHDGRIPVVRDEEDAGLVSSLRSLGLLCSSLSRDIVSERVHFISQLPSGESKQLALRLLTILNETRFDCTGIPELGLSWLPTVNGLSNPTACRDINKYHDRALFDRVLQIVDTGTVQVTSRPLRKALGWDLDISLQVIRDQLSAELEAEQTAVSSKRLSTIIVELGRRVNEIRSDDGLLTQLRKITSQRPWIPVNSSTRAWTRQAVLDHQVVPHGFYHIASTNDTIDFLRLMGCSDRPSNRAILNVLCGMDPDLGSTQSVDDVINLLRAIHVESLTEYDRGRVVAPDCHNYLRPLKELYMDDLGPQACQVELPTDMYKLHREIQQRLATSLGVHTLTSLGLKRFEDVDDDDMQENLCTRISNVLRQYNIDQAFNEFLANAADAGATQYNLLLDERPGRSVDILAPTMSALQSSPSLIVHNDAVFKDEDFAGIRRVGLGGKQDRSDAIGKFGLGSLSMFHFTDMAMILSGGHVLFLDPSRRHLPTNGNRLRSALKIPLSHLKRIHHDHLEVLDGLYGFDKNADYYNGTLFRLPLRAAGHSDISSIRQFPQGISVLLNDYEERAAHSVFFIAVNTLTASRRDALGRLSQMWSINTTRQSSSPNLSSTPICNAVTVSRISIYKPHGNDEKWHIVTEDLSLDKLPLEYHPLIEKQRLRSVSLAIATLVAPRDREKGRKHRLYSKLPLPTLTSLPVHIDASFILADDRRSIRFEEGGQVNLESRYNSWLLTSRVPTLYYFLLESWPQVKGNTVSWPGNSSSNEDPISRLLVHSFYDQISSSSYRFCESLKGERLLPSRVVFEDGETRGVKHILDLMKPARVVGLPSRIRSRLPAEGIRRLDVDFFRELIATQSLLFQSLYESKRITVQQICELVEYMATGRPDSLVDLKILPLVDDSLGVIKKSGNPPFFFAAWSPSWHPWHLFTTRTSRFIHPDFGSPTWPLHECNIERYSASSFISLLQEILTETNSLVPTPEKKEFINRFWHDFVRMSITINQVSNFPLIPTRSGTYISFSHSRDPSTIIYNTDARRPWLGEVLESLGADVVIRDACPRILRNELRDSEFSFDVIMKFLETLGVSNIPRIFRERLDIDAQNRFAVYARKEISSLRSGQMAGPRKRRYIKYTVIYQNVARQLPIWEVSIGDSSGTLVPASDPLLKMLPYWLEEETIESYVNASDVKIIKHNSNLQDVLNIQSLDITDVFRYLQFPSVLPQEQLPLFNQLLIKLLSYATQQLTQISLKVPNSNCLMVNVKTLYAYSQPIFRSTFGQNLQYFLHPAIRDLENKLADVGLKYRVNFASFKSCARFIDSEVKENNSSEGAPAVFDWYNRSMRSFIGNDQSSWQEVKDLAFIPRNDIRRHYTDSSFTAEDYAITLPMVVPPSRILRSEYEAVAWTQRALFDTTPSEQLLLANPTLGIPDSMDVVEHLRLLVVIAADHPFNNNLASDLTETYRWLADHIPDCEAYLLQQQSEKLFLNVDSLTLTIKWEFCSAPQLVFNAPDEGTRMQVRRYLHPFKKLLLAVGAKEVVKPVQPALKLSPAEEVLVKLRTSLNDQRKKEMLTDTVLESNDGQKFPAHKTLLAASTQYFEALFCGGYLETSQTKPVDVDVSGDVLAHVLEYIYLGKIQDIDDQDDLLEMLEVSDLWALPDLFLRVENQLILTITIGTYQELMEKADLYGAKELLAACKKFVDDNAHIF